MRIYIEHKSIPKIFRLWLSRNSNLFFYDDNTYIELWSEEVYKKHSKYYIIKDKETGIQLAFLMIPKVWKLGAIHYNNVFEVTGQGMILRELVWYFDFIRWAWFIQQKYREAHICFDIDVDIQYLHDVILKDYIEEKTAQVIKKKWVIETIYIWERSRQKNTYQLIRIYDKIKDTKFKRKEFLYDFEGVSSRTRFEVELRRDQAIKLSEKKLLDDKYIFAILRRTFYHMNYQFFKFIWEQKYHDLRKLEKWVKHERKKAIVKRMNDFIKYWQDFKDEKDKQRTITMFRNSAKRLYKNGYSREYLLKMLSNYEIK